MYKFNLKMGDSSPLFLLFSSFHRLTVNLLDIIFADDWIRTADLWYRKHPLGQLSHN